MELGRPGHIFHRYITSLEMQSYEFILYYAEELSSDVAEFPHQHALYQIYYVLDGDMRIRVKDEVYTLQKNELLFLSKNIRHHIFYEPDNKKNYFTMIFDFLELSPMGNKGPDGELEWQDLHDVLSEVDRNEYIISRRPFYDRDILKHIATEQNGKELGWNTSVMNYYFQFYLLCCRHISGYRAKDTVTAGKLNLAIEASKYIHAHYNQEISLESVSKFLNISPRHVNRAYQSMFKTTFMRNLTLLRIEYAKKYLSSTSFSIDRIAELVGFSSARILYKIFKENEGISISEYRLRHNPDYTD